MMTQNELKSHPTKGVILVGEAFTEINAGLVIILASGHASPITEADSTRDLMSLLLSLSGYL